MHSEAEVKKNRLKQFYPALTYLKKQKKKIHSRACKNGVSVCGKNAKQVQRTAVVLADIEEKLRRTK